MFNHPVVGKDYRWLLPAAGIPLGWQLANSKCLCIGRDVGVLIKHRVSGQYALLYAGQGGGPCIKSVVPWQGREHDEALQAQQTEG